MQACSTIAGLGGEPRACLVSYVLASAGSGVLPQKPSVVISWSSEARPPGPSASAATRGSSTDVTCRHALLSFSVGVMLYLYSPRMAVSGWLLSIVQKPPVQLYGNCPRMCVARRPSDLFVIWGNLPRPDIARIDRLRALFFLANVNKAANVMQLPAFLGARAGASLARASAFLCSSGCSARDYRCRRRFGIIAIS